MNWTLGAATQKVHVCSPGHRRAGHHDGIVGELGSVSRVLYATGFSGHGFLQGPALGEVLRDLVLRREPSIDVTALSLDRFGLGVRRDERHLV